MPQAAKIAVPNAGRLLPSAVASLGPNVASVFTGFFSAKYSWQTRCRGAYCASTAFAQRNHVRQIQQLADVLLAEGLEVLHRRGVRRRQGPRRDHELERRIQPDDSASEEVLLLLLLLLLLFSAATLATTPARPSRRSLAACRSRGIAQSRSVLGPSHCSP